MRVRWCFSSCTVLLFLFGCCYIHVKAGTHRFWHISDIHYDPDVESTKRSCVKHVADIPTWGSDFCDIKMNLVRSALQAMKNVEANPDFILWTGDSALHYWNGTSGTENEITDILRELSEEIHKFFPTTKVIGSLGNHDFVPDNQLPASSNAIYSNISTHWEQLGWLTGERGDRRSFNDYGYYVVEVNPNLLVFSLNTNFYYPSNLLYQQEARTGGDPGNQFAELEKVLEQAKANNSKVMLSAHVPYGYDNSWPHMYSSFNDRFLTIIRKYHDVIVASFFGHEHRDAFKIVFNEAGEPVSTAFLAPSITPWRYIPPDTGIPTPFHNPAVHLLEYDDTDYRLTERRQFYFNLKEANEGKTPQWSELYRFTTAYGVPDLSVASVLKAAEKVRSNERWQEYVQALFCRPNVPDSDCDATCRKQLMCNIFEVDSSKGKECIGQGTTTPTSAAPASKVHYVPLCMMLSLIWVMY